MASEGAGVEDAYQVAEGATCLAQEVASLAGRGVEASVSFLLLRAAACLVALGVLLPWVEALPSVLA